MKTLLLLTLLTLSAGHVMAHSTESKSDSEATAAASAAPKTSEVKAGQTKYIVKGMHCESCESEVKSKVCALPGIESCEVRVTDSNKKMGEVVITPKTGATVKEADVKKAVKSAGGFRVTEVQH